MRTRAAPAQSGGFVARYRGEEAGFDRQPDSRNGRQPICHAPIICWGPKRCRRSRKDGRGNATNLFGAIERNALARHLIHGRLRGRVFHRHIRAAIAGRDARRTHTRWRHELRRRHRLNRSPNEEGKAGQDYEQSPEDQDPHVCNIRRSLPPFKIRFTGVILTGCTGCEAR
jgi:hypothetical protein